MPFEPEVDQKERLPSDDRGRIPAVVLEAGEDVASQTAALTSTGRSPGVGCRAVSGQDHFRRLERLYLDAPTNDYYRPEIRISEGEAEIVIAVRPEFFHAARGVHGSVYFKALDDAAFFAVNSLVDDVMVLTFSFTVHLLRPVSEGKMRARGRVLHVSRRLFVAEARLADREEREIAIGNGTFTRSSIRLGPEIGYR